MPLHLPQAFDGAELLSQDPKFRTRTSEAGAVEAEADDKRKHCRAHGGAVFALVASLYPFSVMDLLPFFSEICKVLLVCAKWIGCV